MSTTREATSQRIDALMEQASQALVRREYFQTERLCLEALDLAHGGYDYVRMAAIILPLQEARRFKRHLALDAGRVTIVCDQLPGPHDLKPGCYLVCPPRVGLDGRQLRELCDRQEVPALILTREPANRLGHWPIVALGPATVRCTVAPPPIATAKKKPAKPKTAKAPDAPPPRKGDDAAAKYLAAWAAEAAASAPSVEWFLTTAEALGDAAIAQVDLTRQAAIRVEEFFLRLGACPEHEKLHQRLHDACTEAARTGKPPPGKFRPEDELEEDDDEAIGGLTEA